MVTHQMEEVERLCDRVILLRDGVSQAYGTVTEVQDSFGTTVIKVSHEGLLPSSKLYEVAVYREGYSELKVVQNSTPAVILDFLIRAGIKVSRFAESRPSLDDIFIEIYGSEAVREES